MFSDSSSVDPARRRGLGAAAAAAAGAAVAGLLLVTQMGGVAMAGTIASGTQFYADPNSQVVKWDAAHPGDSREPAIASRIAAIPQGIWFSNYRPSTVQSDVSAVTAAAAAAGKTPVLVVYEIPNRDCGGASAGGAPDIGSYENYIQSFANGLGNHQVIVILEPDSLALQTCLSAQQATDRDNAIAFAGARLKSADPAAKVYLDAGHSSWNSPSAQAATLNAAGVRTSSDGIFSNVSNFMTTASEVSYDKQVLGALGNPSNLHIVVDTSRNGNGPAAGNPWCDPSGRALGQNPTANTGDSAVDAFLWIKPPGESDGCADAAGTFDPALAYALITNGGPPPTSSSSSPSTPPSSSTSPSTPPSSSTSPSSPPSSSPGGTGCHITYTKTNEWAGGFTANVDITTSKALSNWTVGFTYNGDQQITNSWNANHTQSGKNVTLSNMSYNGSIGAGQTLTGVGVQGTWGSSDAAPTGFTLNGAACS
ncbi:MAG: cellobiohydrolase [Catenulispora sp.]|nr:cellobiohydrolase [Catenulispora sp.]